jgi:release factor glutamine methyltransferase
MITIREALGDARRKLAGAGIETAALDARLLVQTVTGLLHEELAADPDRMIGAEAVQNLQRMVARRQAHEPVSRILGWREFYGRNFRVTPAVLDPRPDTETLVDEALKHLNPAARILDLGTGSGAIVISLLAECPMATAIATDISIEALAVAKDNAIRLGVAGRIRFVHCSWFEAVSGTFDLLVCNPPYIPLSAIPALPPEVRQFDPLRALDGGPDGLEAYRRIAAEAHAYLAQKARLLVEIGAGMAPAVGGIFEGSGFGLAASAADLAGHLRCLSFTPLENIHWKTAAAQLNTSR